MDYPVHHLSILVTGNIPKNTPMTSSQNEDVHRVNSLYSPSIGVFFTAVIRCLPYEYGLP
jgi:hypothetical protein